uniref:Uncharacterized protein n=1 Tax=Arundo donax TaxID=35708 RepID=A0A0A9HQE4_ARUDO
MRRNQHGSLFLNDFYANICIIKQVKKGRSEVSSRQTERERWLRSSKGWSKQIIFQLMEQ